jgi:membrane dipeptidase
MAIRPYVPPVLSPEVEIFFRDAIVIDAINPSRWGDAGLFQAAKAGGLTAVNITVAIWEDFVTTLANITDWLDWFQRYSEHITPVRAAGDILAAKQGGRIGIILGFQNAAPIENNLRRLRLFYELGVRIIQLTYNDRNLLGDGCYEPRDGGLTRLGREAVREMNRLGILIDLSHVGDRTAREVVECSQGPVAFTHANARSQYDHPRNKPDDLFRLLVEKGGVVGANSFPLFFPRGFDSSLDDYLDSIDYLVNLIGIDHVGIGTDFCMGQPSAWFQWIFSAYGTFPPERTLRVPEPYRHLLGLWGMEEYRNIAAGLLARGHNPEDVRKMLGGNWLRLFGAVWKGT